MRKFSPIFILIAIIAVWASGYYRILFSIEFSALVAIGVAYYIHRNRAVLAHSQYEFINVVTHVFRTPTTVIKWSADNIRKSAVGKHVLDDINQIDSANERVITLIDTLTDFATMMNEARFVFAAVSFREMVEQTLQKYSPKIHEKNISLTIDIPHDIPLISGDTKRLQFVVELLLQNAIMYTPDKGQIYVGIYQDRKYLTMLIKDSGIGIPKNEMKHLFKKFYRGKTATNTDVQGVGVGLFVARKIIEKHHGRIWATSDGEGKGATFYVKLRL